MVRFFNFVKKSKSYRQSNAFFKSIMWIRKLLEGVKLKGKYEIKKRDNFLKLNNYNWRRKFKISFDFKKRSLFLDLLYFCQLYVSKLLFDNNCNTYSIVNNFNLDDIIFKINDLLLDLKISKSISSEIYNRILLKLLLRILVISFRFHLI